MLSSGHLKRATSVTTPRLGSRLMFVLLVFRTETRHTIFCGFITKIKKTIIKARLTHALPKVFDCISEFKLRLKQVWAKRFAEMNIKLDYRFARQ